MTQADQMAAGSFVGCLAGAPARGEYLDGLAAAGFTDASVTFTIEAAPRMCSDIIRAAVPGEPEGPEGDRGSLRRPVSRRPARGCRRHTQRATNLDLARCSLGPVCALHGVADDHPTRNGRRQFRVVGGG